MSYIVVVRFPSTHALGENPMATITKEHFGILISISGGEDGFQTEEFRTREAGYSGPSASTEAERNPSVSDRLRAAISSPNWDDVVLEIADELEVSI
jgi:hypothetical protein